MSIFPQANSPENTPPNEVSAVAKDPASVRKKKIVFLLVGIAISVALILYLFKDLDFEKFKGEFKNFNIWYTIPLTALLFVTMAIRALRSRYLFPRDFREKGSFLSLLEPVLVGFTANSFLPMRAGEIVRPIYLQKRIGLPFASALASIFTERIFDLLALLTIAPIMLSRIPNPPEFLLTTTSALRFISAVGLTGVILCAFFGNFTTNLAKKIVPLILPKKIGGFLLNLLDQVIETLGAVKSIKDLLIILVYSFSLWVVTGYYFQLCGNMLGVDLSLFAGIMITITVAFAVAAPSSPGFIGTFQFGCALTLTNILHYSQEFSLAYGLIVHAIQTVSQVLVTVIVLAISGQTIGVMFKTK